MSGAVVQYGRGPHGDERTAAGGDPWWRSGQPDRGLRADRDAGAARALRRHRLPAGLAAGRQGRQRAAGNRPARQRIEEHGLHVWFGFYENAFDVIRRVYEELDRPADAPLRTWRDAFHPTDEVVLCDDTEDDRWIPRHFRFPDNDGVPGIASEPPGLHRLMHDAIQHAARSSSRPSTPRWRLKALDKFLDGFLLGLEKLLGGDDGDSDLEDLFEAFLRFAGPVLHIDGDPTHATTSR